MGYKVLGQSSPTANTDTTLYTVPASTECVVSTLTICNQNTSNVVIRTAVRPNGATISNEHYIVYNATITGNETFALTFGITMDASDVVTVRSDTTNVSFNLYGSEITV